MQSILKKNYANKIKKEEQDTIIYPINSDHNVPYLILLIDALSSQLQEALKRKHCFGQYFQVFSYFAKLGNEAKRYLLQRQLVGVLFDIIWQNKGEPTINFENSFHFEGIQPPSIGLPQVKQPNLHVLIIS
jgi:hypothetical protein